MAVVATVEQLAIVKAAWEQFGQHMTLREYTQWWFNQRRKSAVIR